MNFLSNAASKIRRAFFGGLAAEVEQVVIDLDAAIAQAETLEDLVDEFRRLEDQAVEVTDWIEESAPARRAAGSSNGKPRRRAKAKR